MNNGSNKNTIKMKPLMTVREVAPLLHVHPNTLRRWSDSGMIQSYRIGSRGDRRFTKEDILRFLSKLESDKGNPKQVQIGWR